MAIKPQLPILENEQAFLHLVHFISMTFTVAFVVVTLLILLSGYPPRRQVQAYTDQPVLMVPLPQTPQPTTPPRNPYIEARPKPPKSVAPRTARPAVTHRNALTNHLPHPTNLHSEELSSWMQKHLPNETLDLCPEPEHYNQQPHSSYAYSSQHEPNHVHRSY